jgi:hypothetical protein
VALVRCGRKGAFLKLSEGLQDLLSRVYDKRSVARNWFIKGFARDKQEADRLVLRLNLDIVSIAKGGQPRMADDVRLSITFLG